MIRPMLLLTGAVLIAGCSTSVPGCGSPPNLAGSWEYAGSQSSPNATLSGTLSLTHTGTCTVSGSLSLTINDGTPATSGWTVSGDFLDDSIFEFDATQGGTDRHHLGTVRADSITGTWMIPGGSANGSFTLARTGP